MRYCYNIFLGCLLSFSGIVFAASPIASQIDTLLTSPGAPATVGILVKNAQTNEVVYTTRSQEGFTPASVMKLFTVAAALSELGPDYQFATSLQYQSAQRSGAVLNGNLYVVFTGDPTLRSQDLVALIRQIKAQGITQIQGDLIIDDTRFSGPVYGRGWSQDDLGWYYSAPITSVILDENKTEVKLVSNKKINDKATLTTVASPPILNVISDVITVTPAEAENLCQFNTELRPHNTIYFYGCWPQMKEPKIFKMAITDPNLVARNIIAQTLKDSGISLTGGIKTGITAPKDYQVFAKHDSITLSELVKPLLRDSNNIYTESLTKTLGYARYQRGTFQAGAQAMQDILVEKFKLSENSMKLFDGSGLSSYSILTPESVGQLLSAMYHDPVLKDFYMGALANNENSPEAGTLRIRLQNLFFKKDAAQIRAKTGSMTGISTFAGYLERPNHPTLIFVIMTNQLLDKPEQSKKFQNDFLKILSQ